MLKSVEREREGTKEGKRFGKKLGVQFLVQAFIMCSLTNHLGGRKERHREESCLSPLTKWHELIRC